MNKVLSFKEYLVLKEQFETNCPNLHIRQINKFLIESVIEENIKNYIRNNSSNKDLIKDFEVKENVKIDNEYKETGALDLIKFRWFRNSNDFFKEQPKVDNSGYVFMLNNERIYNYIYITSNKELYRFIDKNNNITDDLILNAKKYEKISFKEYPHLQYLTSLINSQLK